MENVLKELHDAEKEALTIIEKAKKDSTKTIANARKNSEQSMLKLKNSLDQDHSKTLEHTQKQVAKEIKAINAASDAQIIELNKNAISGSKKAVKIILDKLLRG